jgi:heme exporter protein A
VVALGALPSGDAEVADSNAGLVVDDLARRYGPRWAVARVSFTVAPGTACQLTGPNGSGKSTLLRCAATAIQPHHGQVRFDGRDVWTHRRSMRHEISFLSHDSRLYEDLSAVDNLRSWARLGGYSTQVDELIEKVGLDPKRTDPVRMFSAGMRRRLALAVALMKTPKLLLLDEPFAALDPVGRELVLDVVRDICAQGAVVLMATHHPEEAALACTQHVRLESGRKVTG